MPKKHNNDASQTAEAINIIQTLINKQEIKDNKYIFKHLVDYEPVLKDQLVKLCLRSKPSKDE